ncbi:hypothetical protein K503DRAFT_805429 [Rhizopogon vinicolor AM-OR11-026]|uniref:Uncharacterized protein n=1 Tax=Rhizopogon vinicolor AM-OR11-026 TaxID=1314800 RepID=A0A1B7MHV7_9AGAM|nr:hypothetical protein K503DRAFT_805429 [Rhizopogon vinicolor AM-OR11-026]
MTSSLAHKLREHLQELTEEMERITDDAFEEVKAVIEEVAMDQSVREKQSVGLEKYASAKAKS